MERKLQVAALKNGTVIDHLPAKKLFKIFTVLKLQYCANTITFGNNLESQRIGQKGIIKISDRFFANEEIDKIALIAPNAKINIIKNYEVVEKHLLVLPDVIQEIVRCPNPSCITNHQPIRTKFMVINEQESIRLKCHYCEKEVEREEVILKNDEE